MAIASDVEKRQQVAEKLLVAARSEADVDRFFYRLQAAAPIGTWQDFAELERIQRSIKVLQVAKRKDSISQRELQQLVDDLRLICPRLWAIWHRRALPVEKNPIDSPRCI